jgi:aldose 1-epimerase
MTDARLSTVRLYDEQAGLEATFVPGANMLCCSLRHRGVELLAQNDGVAAYAEYGKTMGIPLLYPWANRLAAFDYSVAGRKVRVPHDPARIALDDNGLPIHGVIGGRQAWELTQTLGTETEAGADAPASGDAVSGTGASSDTDARTLAARLSWSEAQPQLFEVFPFRHDLLYEARLIEGRLEIEVIVHASGDDVVPLAFGFHPYLAPQGASREGWLIELPAMRHLVLDADQIPIGPDTANSEQASSAQRFELAEREFDDGFDSVAEPARFAVTTSDRRIELELRQGYPCAQVYAPLSGSFICFEPMTAPANALRSGDGLRLLNPGERYSAGFSVGVS